MRKCLQHLFVVFQHELEKSYLCIHGHFKLEQSVYGKKQTNNQTNSFFQLNMKSFSGNIIIIIGFISMLKDGFNSVRRWSG